MANRKLMMNALGREPGETFEIGFVIDGEINNFDLICRNGRVTTNHEETRWMERIVSY